MPIKYGHDRMALLKNRFQFLHYGICENTIDACKEIRIESFLNSNTLFREYITDIIEYSDDGTEPIFYEVLSTEKYQNLKNLLNLDESDLLDDRLKPSFKNFNCGSIYIFVCKDIIDIHEGEINLPGFANVASSGIPIEKTGLVTTECCVSEQQLPTPIKDRYQFIWYGLCSNCSNKRIEEVLNERPEYREYITDIIKYSDDGTEPIFYEVLSTEKYQNLKNLLNLDESDLLDDRLKPSFKNFNCGESYIVTCRGDISILPDGILIENITSNNINARIGRCNADGIIDFKLDPIGCEEPINIVFPESTPPNITTNIAILVREEKPNEADNWKDISYWDYISYGEISNTEKEPTIPQKTPTPTITNSDTPDETPTASLFYEELPVYEICESLMGCPPKENELDEICDSLKTPTPSNSTPQYNTPTPSLDYITSTPVADGKLKIEIVGNNSIQINRDWWITVIDIGCTECGFTDSLQSTTMCPPSPSPSSTFIVDPPSPTPSSTFIVDPPTPQPSPSPSSTFIVDPPTPSPSQSGCAWYDCNGDCEGPATNDCAGICNGNTKIDCLGVCGGDATLDCAGICNGPSITDCLGVCNGDATSDCAGICNGDTKFDCAGICGGNTKIDACGECGGNIQDPNDCPCVKDCAGVCNGDAKLDCAGVCNGDAKLDCAGICNGNTEIDCDGICGGDSKLDCAGICNGDSKLDCNGICNGNTKIDCAGVCGGNAETDCANICNGNTEIDCAGVCDGDSTLDCAGICNGDARLDCAGVCNGDTKIDCLGVCGGDAILDCAGICNGNTQFDCLGVCNGDAKLDCAGICNGDTKFDCAGICGGNTKIDACGECGGNIQDPNDCPCVKDCAGVCNGDAKLDCAGVCNGDAKLDCAGICNGNSFFDCKGVCNGNAKVDCAGICDGDAKRDCKGVCNGDAKKDCAGVCGGDAKRDCKGVCNGNAKRDCKGVCGGNAKLDCAGICDGNTRRDCAGICGGNTPIDCAGICGGNTQRDCKGICGGNTKRDCAGICGGNTKVDICGVCGGPGRVPDDCCKECEESFGELELFNHGFGWKGEQSVEMRMMIKDRSAPVWEVANNTYRIYGDLKVPIRNPLPLYDLARFRKDANANPNRGEGTLATSLETDSCMSLGERTDDSTHLRFLDNNAVKIDNQSKLITIQTRILTDEVTESNQILKWKHTFTLREQIEIKDGDTVFIRSITNGLYSTYSRGVVSDEGNGKWSILAGYNEKRPFASAKNRTVLFVLNRIAIPTVGTGPANNCNRGELLLPGESDVFKYKSGDSIKLLNSQGREFVYKINDLNEQKGTLTIDGILRGHINWWTFALNDNAPGIARTSDQQNIPTFFDDTLMVKNETNPCMIRLESRTDIPNTWEEQVGPFGTMIVFDARLNGKMWAIHRINSLDRKLFYVRSKSTDGKESILCSDCSCVFRIRNDQNAQVDPPSIGPRSVCAVTGNNIRNHAIKSFKFPSINPELENDKLAIKTRENGENYVPYMTGYLAKGIIHPDLIDLANAERIDYWEFDAGDYEV